MIFNHYLPKSRGISPDTKMDFEKETSRFEVFMEHFPRSVESGVTTVCVSIFETFKIT